MKITLEIPGIDEYDKKCLELARYFFRDPELAACFKTFPHPLDEYAKSLAWIIFAEVHEFFFPYIWAYTHANGDPKKLEEELKQIHDLIDSDAKRGGDQRVRFTEGVQQVRMQFTVPTTQKP